MAHYIPNEPELKHLGPCTIGGNPQTYYYNLWQWMVKDLQIKSVLDVGCGEGHAMRAFQKFGCNVTGFDGAPRNAALANAFCCDLTKQPFEAGEFDLIWCSEVVGQIEAKYLQNILDTFKHGTTVAFTHQLPEQAAWYMTNCQLPAYWEEAMKTIGYCIDTYLTEVSMQFGHDFWLKTGCIYRRI